MKIFHLALVAAFSAELSGAEPAVSTPTPTPPPAPALPVETPAPKLREVINGLDEAQVKKAMEAIEGSFLSADSLDEAGRQRALLEGIIRRLSPGLAIFVGPPPPPRALLPFLAEILDERAGYIRPGALDAATLAQVDTALASFAEKKLPAVILDLRAVPAGSEFEMAADFARRFSPRGKMLFTIQKPSAKQERILTADKDPLFTGMLVVLTDPDTSGAAEALAATLRANAKAMIVGTDTAGEAVEFQTFPLGSEKVLRVAVAQAILPDGKSIFPDGVKPDVAISLPAGLQEEIFLQSREKGVGHFVFEQERPRMNEAALVANTNPEIDGTPVARAERLKSSLRDTVLQRAMDLITAVSFFNSRE